MISAVIPLRYDQRRRYYQDDRTFRPQSRCIEALLAQEKVKEILVVNHTLGPDPQIEYLGSTFPSLKIINITEGNWLFNQSWLLNIGIRHMTQEYFMRVDIDCILEPTFSDRFIGILNPNFICCAVCNTSRYTNWDTFKYPDSFTDYLTGQHRNHGWSHILVQREVLMEIGGYDERFQVWGGEDTDMHERLKRRGLEPIFGTYWFLHQDHTALGSCQENLSHSEICARNAMGAFLKDTSIQRNGDQWGQITRPHTVI